MNQDVTFIYTYSANENTEVQEIRKKYLPCAESKLDELKRLDYAVQTSGMTESLCTGVGGALVLGLGMCLTMQIIGNGVLLMVLGVLLSMIGIGATLAAYPIYRRVFSQTKAKFAPRILELTAELSDGTR